MFSTCCLEPELHKYDKPHAHAGDTLDHDCSSRQRPRLEVAGFGVEDVDGSVERTEAMVGEVVGGWGGILKSTPPAKLLSRPPVRCEYI